MRVLIVPDKFKGTLDARRVAAALARGWLKARPRDTLDIVPMSDGGDGFGPVVGGLLGAVARSTRTVDADTSSKIITSRSAISGSILTRLP